MWKIEGIQVSVVIHMAVRQYSMIYTHYVTYKAVPLGKHQQELLDFHWYLPPPLV